MARSLPTPCTQPGCPALVEGGGRCPRHREPAPEKGKLANGGRVYDRALWDALCALVRAEEPLCRACQVRGEDRAGEEVDHIVPLARGGAPFDRENLQHLCKPCHSRKTLRETGGGQKS